MAIISPVRAVHLAIDVQAEFLRYLDPERQKEFPHSVRQFANELREQHGIPTIWVAMVPGQGIVLYRPTASIPDGEPREPELVEKFGLGAIGPRTDEIILVKSRGSSIESADSAFAGTALIKYLKELGISDIIVTGMNTHGCVADSIADAIQSNALHDALQCHVMTDLLAASRTKASAEEDRDLTWHEGVLRKILGATPLVHYYISGEFLRSLKAGFVSPKRQILPHEQPGAVKPSRRGSSP